MTKRRLSSLTLCLMLGATVTTVGCKKKPDETVNPDEATDDGTDDGTVDGAEGDSGEEDPGPTLPEQDPDPAEIADLYQRLLQGDYHAVAEEAAALRTTLTADTQVRADALAASIQAIASSRDIPENAQEPGEHAVEAGERLGDSEVLQFAHAAHAAYLTGVQEAAAAQEELEKVVDHDGAYAMFARLALAESHLNQAFGTGEDDTKVVAPERLDDAAAEYEKVVASGVPLLEARALEGLAAVADYKRDKAAACDYLQQAEDKFAAGDAVDFHHENISHHAKALRCKDFKSAE